MRISIIGIGEMGKWFAEFAQEMDWSLAIADVDSEKAKTVSKELDAKFCKSNEEAASLGDLVLISVPIEKTPEVIEEVSPHTKDDSLLIDIASVKEKTVQKMRDIETESELASIHPLFGPGAEGLKGKNLISIPVEVGKKYRRFKKALEEFGAEIEEMNASDHDKLMANIQSLTHSTLLVYLSAFNSMDNTEKAIKYQTPMLRGLLDSCRAFLKEDPALCGDIQTKNRHASMARESLLKSCRSFKAALDTGHVSEIRRIFEESRENLGMNDIKEAYKKLYEELESEKK